MWPVTGIFISSKVAVRIKVPESAEFFSYPLFSTRLGNRSKMQCTCTHIFRAPLAQLRRQLLPRSAPEPCHTRPKKQLRVRSRGERELFFGPGAGARITSSAPLLLPYSPVPLSSLSNRSSRLAAGSRRRSAGAARREEQGRRSAEAAAGERTGCAGSTAGERTGPAPEERGGPGWLDK